MRKILFIGLIAAATSCSYFSGETDKGRVIARVFDLNLYEEDLLEVMPAGLSTEDSTVWANKFVNNWGKEQLIIKKAEFNLADQEKNFENLVLQYRNDLLKFTYQERFVSEHLDTNISEAQILNYYQEHQSEFELKENIVILNYLVLAKEAPDLVKVRKWFRSREENQREDLEDYAFHYAKSFSFGDTNWVRYNDLSKFIPFQNYNQQEFLSRNKFVELSDSSSLFLVEIVEYKIADDVSPLTYVESTIKNIILNKRKQELVASMEERLVNDAYEKNDFEIY